jgi:hypothetical protein
MPAIFARLLILSTALAVCGCTRSVGLPAAEELHFDPIMFFAGHTHGEGDLRKLFAKPVHVSVDSVGRMVDGSLILDQTIRESNKAPSARRWTIRRVSPDRYSGTLTEATGDVRGRSIGPRAYIAYSMKRGLDVEQQLAEQSDRATVINRLVVRKFGVQVASLSETIRRVD